ESKFRPPPSFRSGDICDVVSSLHSSSTKEDKDLHSVLRLFNANEIKSVFTPAQALRRESDEQWASHVGEEPLKWEKEVAEFPDFRCGSSSSVCGSSSSSSSSRAAISAPSLLQGGRIECFCAECRAWVVKQQARRRAKDRSVRGGGLSKSSSSIQFTTTSSMNITEWCPRVVVIAWRPRDWWKTLRMTS
ncbi:unnamed protein product, partial [Amoebophrya sp. A25]